MLGSKFYVWPAHANEPLRRKPATLKFKSRIPPWGSEGSGWAV